MLAGSEFHNYLVKVICGSSLVLSFPLPSSADSGSVMFTPSQVVLAITEVGYRGNHSSFNSSNDQLTQEKNEELHVENCSGEAKHL